jgi:hypothetical protein
MRRTHHSARGPGTPPLAASPPSSTVRSARGLAGSYPLVGSSLDAFGVNPRPAGSPHPRWGRSPVGSPATPATPPPWPRTTRCGPRRSWRRARTCARPPASSAPSASCAPSAAARTAPPRSPRPRQESARPDRASADRLTATRTRSPPGADHTMAPPTPRGRMPPSTSSNVSCSPARARPAAPVRPAHHQPLEAEVPHHPLMPADATQAGHRRRLLSCGSAATPRRCRTGAPRQLQPQPDRSGRTRVPPPTTHRPDQPLALLHQPGGDRPGNEGGPPTVRSPSAAALQLPHRLGVDVPLDPRPGGGGRRQPPGVHGRSAACQTRRTPSRRATGPRRPDRPPRPPSAPPAGARPVGADRPHQIIDSRGPVSATGSTAAHAGGASVGEAPPGSC